MAPELRPGVNDGRRCMEPSCRDEAKDEVLNTDFFSLEQELQPPSFSDQKA